MSANNRKIGSGLESLEQRALMAADINFNNGILTITGDEGADYAYVTFQGDEVQVDVYRPNGNRLTLETDQDERIRDVKEIRFDAKGGADELIVQQRQLNRGVSGINITYDAGAGDDRMDNLSSVRSTANGGAGADKLLGGSVRDVLNGGTEGDELDGRKGDDKLFGESGKDYLYGGLDYDEVSGGEGDDWISGDRYGDITAGQKDYLFGNSGVDEIHGGGGDDYIWGDDGVAASGETDYLFGDDGIDVIHGDGGGDRVDGGTGNDWLYGDDAVDAVIGGMGEDHLFGGAATDYLYGDFENDPYHGDGDWLQGGYGADVLQGGGGDDFLQGGEVGADSDLSIDLLYGQEGKDTFEEPDWTRPLPWWKVFSFDSRVHVPRDKPMDIDTANDEKEVNWY